MKQKLESFKKNEYVSNTIYREQIFLILFLPFHPRFREGFLKLIEFETEYTIL